MTGTGVGHPHIVARSLEMPKTIVKRIDAAATLIEHAHRYLACEEDRDGALQSGKPRVEADPHPALVRDRQDARRRIGRGTAASKLQALRRDRYRRRTPRDHRTVPATLEATRAVLVRGVLVSSKSVVRIHENESGPD